ncbi:uncharacterized protein LOC135073715 isoform X3 [Ostrinia nubilalis]|uniref:uncharacterized protein LOC135073715 isoform X3 n=1 Tax=Ostrinia nubilalis TaxID=29057 RepID=UPI00308232CA
MMMISVKCVWTRTRTWILVAVVMMMVMEAIALSGPNVCMVKQKYNITKRIKYRAPMSVRTYEWCFSMPPRCSRWNTEMRDLTRLETEERTAEVAVCCPGYKMKEVSCVPICPNGKTGPGCSEDCQPNRWGPNCVNECKDCSDHGVCSPINGECVCQQGWQEPEHITAVMTDKGTERSSVDLVSVISIAGGVMMAVITVAVIIVMIERCKKPRYEDVRKINDIRMQVMIDNNDVPPPYVRSIFHTPLPDPPNSEKCHYQPISTLDRNLKQFMRPVVVQQISPVMLENFRGILECHYDHLPRRSHEFTDVPRKCHDFGSQQMRCSVTPSITISEQLNLQRASLTESAIEALKCEAKLDVIDTTTAESEPLYAEIPCWRPPSEHAVEIINMNGEAVTEL